MTKINIFLGDSARSPLILIKQILFAEERNLIEVHSYVR